MAYYCDLHLQASYSEVWSDPPLCVLVPGPVQTAGAI